MDILASLQSIGFDWQVALAHLVNFLLVVWLLNHFVFAPLQKTIAKRRDKIESGIADAKKAKQKRRDIERQREAILEAAREKRQEIVSEAHKQADEIIANTKEEARREAEQIKQQAREDMQKQREKMQEDLRNAVGKLAVQSAEQILRREVEKADHDEIVSKVVTEAGSNA